MTRRLISFLAPLALLGLSACASPFKADVARFQALPSPEGQSFVVQTENPKLQGGLEFSQYAGMVSRALQAQGYRVSDSAQGATLVVNLDYGVDNGQEKVVTRPGAYAGYGYPYYYGRWGRPYYWDWDDPFWYSPFGYPEVDSYTVFTSYLTMTISRTADGQRVFEGKAKARSTEDSLPKLIPNLIAAMFTNFPGQSGEEVRITIPPTKR